MAESCNVRQIYVTQVTDVIRTGSGGATPGPGRSYALPLKKQDLALGPACDILIF